MTGNYTKTLHVGSPQMGDPQTLINYIKDIFHYNWWTNDGDLVQTFESNVKSLLGVNHCIALVNGTIALQIAAKACDVVGDIVVPAFTFPATAYAFLWMGYRVHLCDIDPVTHLIDIDQLEHLLHKNPQISGVVPVHLWGEVCDVNTLTSIADAYNCKLIYDAAHAFLCHNQTFKYIGSSKDCEVFSFHATKFFSTAEGGAITTNDDEIARKAKLLRNFGFAGTDDVQMLGINGKMHEITAAVGLMNLDQVDHNKSVCMRNYEMYKRLVEREFPEITFKNGSGNHQYVVIEIDESVVGVSRDQVLSELVNNKILARRYFWPGCHKIPPFDTLNLNMPATDKVASQILCLPTGTSIEKEDIYRVVDVIKTAIRK